MTNDILFKTDEYVFSYRVGGILINDNKILLQKPLDDDGYSIIGGHVAIKETTEETLKREFKEEIKADISIERLFAVGEIFFPWGKRPCHQISLYYIVHLCNEKQIPFEGIFKGFDDFGNDRLDIDFCWISLDKLDDLKVYPEELMPYIVTDSKNVIHFVSNQL